MSPLAVPTTTVKRKRSLSSSSSSAEALPDERQAIRRKGDVEDQAVDQANQIIQQQDREVRYIVPTRSGLFDNAHNLDVTGGNFMAAGGSINIYHNAPPPNSASPVDGSSPVQLTTPSPSRSSVIYHRSLITKGRGSPLWIPEPNNALHIAYQRKGVSFGDVGLLSPSGSFDFFFNICYPSDDPINSGGVPEDFKPFKPSPYVTFRRVQEFKTASYVASESIMISRKECINTQTADLVFESSATEGAILTMPHGALSEDVVSTLYLQGYVLENVESWYKHIMCYLGCDVQNGDIVVVTGCDKTDSWGVATFVKSSKHSEAVKLTFQPIPSNRSYKWEYSGSFDARTGPDSGTIEGLPPSTGNMDMVSSEPLLNQCVFVRTLTGKLRDNIWKSLRRSMCLRLGLDPDEDVYEEEESFMKGDGHGTIGHSGGSTDNGNSMRDGGSGKQRQHLLALKPSISVVSNVSTAMMNHPSKLLNRFLWTNSGHKYPSARVVITEDKDWISVLRDSDSTFPDTEELYRRIIERDPDFLDRSFCSVGSGDSLHPTHDINSENEAGIVVDPSSSSSSHPTPSQRRHMSVQQQSSDSSHDVNPGDARHAPTSQVQDPSSKGSSSKAAYPHLQPLRRPGFLTRSFAPALINISHSIVSGGTFNQQEWAGFAHLLENVATAALYDSIRVIDPPKCYPNTRVAIIQTIIDWTLGKAGEELSEKPILWLKGGAGAGKSAIARSVAERCSDDGLLLGTFCFGAADTTRNHVGRLVATIAYQMCRILPELRKIVTSLIEDDPLVFSRSIGSQFADLITRPLSAVLANRPTGSSAAPRLIIIDGLDECSSIDSQRELLFTLRETIHTTSLIQFLVCSRPERDLNRIFSRPRMVSILHKIFLDNDYSAREDIRIYFEDKFRQIKEGHAFKDKLPYLWPTREMVDTLVDNSSGQFIYAATVVRYVESPRHRPDQRLDAIFNLRPPFEDLPFRELDALYRHIISKAEDLPIVLDIIAFPALYGRFNAEDIEAILQLEQGSVEVLLVDLHSIVTISDGYVKVLYKSLEDFLSEPQRAGDLYRDLSRARLSHIARIISIFSTLDARQAGHVCMDIPIMDVLEELKNSENMKADYVSSDILQASKQFPIFKFFKPLLLYGRTEQEFRISFPSLDSAWHFIPRYFHYLFYIKDVSESTWTVYWDQMRQYCECVLSVLDDNWSDNWKAHFVYAYYHLLQDPRYGLPRVISHVDLSDIDAGAFGDTILHVLGPSHMDSPYPYSDDIVKISHSLIGDIKKEQIFAMSARFCLAFLCAEWMTRRDAVRIDGIAGHARHKKREHPWHWRHMVPSRRSLNLGNRLVLIALRENLQQEYKVTLTSMSSLNRPYLDAHIRVITMREYSEVKSKPVPNKSSSLMDYKDHQRWPLYIFLLDLLPYILPLSGRYEPLLTMCRQRCFSSLSQFWPKKSVRARQAIEGYLRRMDSEERSE